MWYTDDFQMNQLSITRTTLTRTCLYRPGTCLLEKRAPQLVHRPCRALGWNAHVRQEQTQKRGQTHRTHPAQGFSESSGTRCSALRINQQHSEFTRQKDMYLQVVGTQHTFAGVCHTISTADGIVDHRAGHDFSAILQRGSSVLAAVKLGNKDSKNAGTGSALCKRAQTHTHSCLLGSATRRIMVIY